MSSAVAPSSTGQRLAATGSRAGELKGPGEAPQALAVDLLAEAALTGREHHQPDTDRPLTGRVRRLLAAPLLEEPLSTNQGVEAL